MCYARVTQHTVQYTRLKLGQLLNTTFFLTSAALFFIFKVIFVFLPIFPA